MHAHPATQPPFLQHSGQPLISAWRWHEPAGCRASCSTKGVWRSRESTPEVLQIGASRSYWRSRDRLGHRKIATGHVWDPLTPGAYLILMVMTMITQNPHVMPCTMAAFRRGFVAALPFIISNGVGGIVMGVAYRGLGLDFGSAVLFSLVVYSATAQAVTLGLWALPPPIAAMVIACVAMNARYLVMGAHLRQLFVDLPKRIMLPILDLR